MTKLINEPITVHQNKDSQPAAFIWRKRLYRIIEVFDWWREPVDWWDEESISLFVRVNAENSNVGTYELCKTDDNWLLSRILD